MSLQHMIELSILDAMGLLDEDERQQFESAFRKAPPAVQAHVRREQTRLSRIESILPAVDPPAGLRAMVLDALRAHMAAEVADDGLSNLVIPMARSNRVNPMWRAGAIGLAAASIVLGFTTFFFQTQFNSLTDLQQQGSIIDAMSRELGPTFVRDILFDGDTQRVVMTASRENYKGQAAIFINPDWRSAKFFCRSMSSPEGKNFKLAILDNQGKVVQVLKEFSSSGELMPIEVDIEPGVQGNIAIMLPGDQTGQNEVVLSGEIRNPQV
jgi:hypothetical protein